ncbi:MAG TPA: pyridoxal-phosphate dependent enzyme [Acidiferrobacterales bacterium]|nr:pyridoxal-phosphate dependent enzyme [Acidiferrobacterales bacterium]
MNPPDLAAIRAAAKRIERYARRTPVFTCESLNLLADAELFFKCENFQKVGAFKFRGACNAVFSLSNEEAKRGVATHSSGNHAAALALAAKLRGIDAHIVMPSNAPEVKRAAVAGYGGKITLCEPTLAAREATIAQIVERTGAVLVHPYNDYRVIAGQGTAALELMQEIPSLDVVMTPVGGGGLLSGTCIAVTGVSPAARIIAAEPQGADDAFRSLKAGKIIPMTDPKTIADGLRSSLGDRTFAIMQKHVHEIITVSEEAIIHAMRQVWERMKIIIEASAAVPVAAVLQRNKNIIGRRVGIILSGGNVDLEKLPWRGPV